MTLKRKKRKKRRRGTVNLAGEKNFENRIKNYLSDKGVWYVKFFANGFTKQGVPDLLCCVNGFFVAVEVKQEYGKATEIQKWNIEEIRYSGGLSFILRPSQFESFKMLIETLLKENRQDVIYKLDSQVFRNLYGLAE